MSVSKKVLRKMKKVMGVVGTSAVLVPCSSQVSCADVRYVVDDGTLYVVGTNTNKCGKEVTSINEALFPRYSFGSPLENGVRLATKIVIMGDFSSIEMRAFDGFKALEEIEIFCDIRRIGPLSFNNLKNLKKISIDNTRVLSPETLGRLASGGIELKKFRNYLMAKKSTLLSEFANRMKEIDNKVEKIGKEFDEWIRNYDKNGSDPEETVTLPFDNLPFYVTWATREEREKIRKDLLLSSRSKLLSQSELALVLDDGAVSGCENLKQFEVKYPTIFGRNAFVNCDTMKWLNGKTFSNNVAFND